MLFAWGGGCCTCRGIHVGGKVRGHQRGVCEGVCGYHKVILGCVRTVQWLN